MTVPPGPVLSDALLSSPIIMGEDGSGVVPGMAAGGFEFGVDPNEDPELALVSHSLILEEVIVGMLCLGTYTGVQSGPVCCLN